MIANIDVCCLCTERTLRRDSFALGIEPRGGRRDCAGLAFLGEEISSNEFVVSVPETNRFCMCYTIISRVIPHHTTPGIGGRFVLYC